MNPLDDLDLTSMPVDDGGGLLLELVAAVDYLRRGVFPGFTVWDGIEQALRWHVNIEADFAESDPLARAIRVAIAQTGQSSASALDAAIRAWIDSTSAVYNEGHRWRQPDETLDLPHPFG
jgi:hypothetical protein